jgi:tRNA(Arg) A34 adenosine deaminase TadA
MFHISRRILGTGAGASLLASSLRVPLAKAQGRSEAPALHQKFIDAAERMRRGAVAAGDQSYGAVVVRDGQIIGWGPSRVVVDRSPDAHAERVAIWDALKNYGSPGLAGAVLYSTSRACPVCEATAARAGVSRMYWGAKGVDAGTPTG